MQKSEREKLELLTNSLSQLPSLAVAFSGGTDSAFLLKAAQLSISGRLVAITSSSALFPERELEGAKSFCTSLGVEHIIISTDE
ncbi:MAG: hypothetical protein LBP51_01685, partial [Deferribacteraceae bacterium]|nr:hypothetical protein [Deferribacteraceae bacterium]